MMWVAITILAVCAAVLAVKACLGMSTADRAENLVRDLTNADRIWRESTALNAINTERKEVGHDCYAHRKQGRHE